MRLIAFSIVIVAGAVAYASNRDVGSGLIGTGVVLGIAELAITGFWKEAWGLLVVSKHAPQPSETMKRIEVKGIDREQQ